MTDPTRGLEPKTWNGQSVEVERFLEEDELIELYKRMHRNKFPLRWQAAIWLITAMGRCRLATEIKRLQIPHSELQGGPSHSARQAQVGASTRRLQSKGLSLLQRRRKIASSSTWLDQAIGSLSVTTSHKETLVFQSIGKIINTHLF